VFWEENERRRGLFGAKECGRERETLLEVLGAFRVIRRETLDVEAETELVEGSRKCISDAALPSKPVGRPVGQLRKLSHGARILRRHCSVEQVDQGDRLDRISPAYNRQRTTLTSAVIFKWPASDESELVDGKGMLHVLQTATFLHHSGLLDTVASEKRLGQDSAHCRFSVLLPAGTSRLST